MKAAKTVLAEHITAKIADVQHFKSQKRIAQEVGFDSPNFVSMLKTGEARLPIDRVVDLAKSLECDPAELMHLTLNAAFGREVAGEIVELLGGPLTDRERELLRLARVYSGNDVPPLSRIKRRFLREIMKATE